MVDDHSGGAIERTACQQAGDHFIGHPGSDELIAQVSQQPAAGSLGVAPAGGEDSARSPFGPRRGSEQQIWNVGPLHRTERSLPHRG
jgi:hypothetical protein